MKCFQKAVSLNEFNEEACLAYGDVAVDLEDQVRHLIFFLMSA